MPTASKTYVLKTYVVDVHVYDKNVVIPADKASNTIAVLSAKILYPMLN